MAYKGHDHRLDWVKNQEPRSETGQLLAGCGVLLLVQALVIVGIAIGYVFFWEGESVDLKARQLVQETSPNDTHLTLRWIQDPDNYLEVSLPKDLIQEGARWASDQKDLRFWAVIEGEDYDHSPHEAPGELHFQRTRPQSPLLVSVSTTLFKHQGFGKIRLDLKPQPLE